MQPNENVANQLRERARDIVAHLARIDEAGRHSSKEVSGIDDSGLRRQDDGLHVGPLAEAIARGEPALFIDHTVWTRSMEGARGVSIRDCSRTLGLLKQSIAEVVGKDAVEVVIPYVDAALVSLREEDDGPPSFISDRLSNGALARTYLDHLLCGDRRQAATLAESAVNNGMDLKRLYLDVFQRSQWEIGRLWQLNQVTVAQEHFCTAATQAIMNQFMSRILATPRNGRKVFAACVEGELHEVGLRIVTDLLEHDGWDCTYVGANTPTVSVLATLSGEPPDLIAISASMTFNVRHAASLIQHLRAEKSLAATPILVGGRPFTISGNLWRTIGADGCAADGESALDVARDLVDIPRPG